MSGSDLGIWPGIAEWGVILLSGEPPQHQVDHADLHPRLARCRVPLVVTAVDPAPTQPGERPLHHPTPGDHLELLAPPRPADDLDHIPAMLRPPRLQRMVVVLVVRPQQLQPGE